MQQFNAQSRRWLALLLLVSSLVLMPCVSVQAAPTDGWQAADEVQKALNRAQVALFSTDQPAAIAALTAAQQVYNSRLAPLALTATAALAQGEAALQQALQAAQQNDQTSFGAASGMLQTALYQIGYDETIAALQQGDPDAASAWLRMRAFRRVSQFERLNSDATRALADLKAGKLDSSAALALVQVDLLDTYQARLTAALHDLQASDAQARMAGRAQHAALAEGYFGLLTGAYRDQRGAAAVAEAQQRFAQLRQAASAGQSIAPLLTGIDTVLRGFRAAPLSAAEQQRRAGQALRFIGLVSVEYSRGVKGGQVTIPLEIQEAATFRDGAAAAFADLRSLLEARDPAKTQHVATLLASLEQHLRAAKEQRVVASPAEIETNTQQIVDLLKQIMPPAWQQHDSSADFDVINSALDKMEQAVNAGHYDLAESARLEAYAILESSPEAKLIVFAPQLKPVIEELFWYGYGSQPGLAALIEQRASLATITTARQALDAQLAAAEETVGGNNAPAAVATNAAVIVFREGFEAVLILASLLGSLKGTTQRTLRRPLWLGTILALVGSALTWLLAQTLLANLASYGTRLEAIVSLIALGVLLLITNWFFHDVYWTGWMANFHRQKKRIMSSTGQWLGLVLLGFTSIYREGFETVLFLQALVLEGGTATVLTGVAVGLAGTFLIGLLVFAVQAKLPHKKMLIFTGVLIGFVLLQMVGNTVHLLQVVGWLPIHPIRELAAQLPYWSGLWLGFYATWEGIMLQIAAGGFTIGSYYLAEYLHKREARIRTTRTPALDV